VLDVVRICWEVDAVDVGVDRVVDSRYNAESSRVIRRVVNESRITPTLHIGPLEE
jgi:hypothetical protein